MDIAYPPLFQSGGNYELKMGAASDDAVLHDNVVLVALGEPHVALPAGIVYRCLRILVCACALSCVSRCRS